MANHSSASVRERTPHSKRISRTNTIVNALKRRAQSVLNDESIDPQSRAIIRYALEINDPWLARLVRRADAGEPVVDSLDSEETSEDINCEKLEALTELICRAGDEPETKSVALLVLMATIEKSSHPKAVADIVKHLAFIRCSELNVYDLVDAEIAEAERKLFMENGLMS